MDGRGMVWTDRRSNGVDDGGSPGAVETSGSGDGVTCSSLFDPLRRLGEENGGSIFCGRGEGIIGNKVAEWIHAPSKS